MQIAGIIDGARKVVRILARVKAGEKVLIAADTDTVVVAEALAAAALDITPEVVTTVMQPVAVDGDEPPALVGAALLAADVALLPVTRAQRRALADSSAIPETHTEGAFGIPPSSCISSGKGPDSSDASSSSEGDDLSSNCPRR